MNTDLTEGEEEFTCICAKFSKDGILCSHILKIVSMPFVWMLGCCVLAQIIIKIHGHGELLLKHTKITTEH